MRPNVVCGRLNERCCCVPGIVALHCDNGRYKRAVGADPHTVALLCRWVNTAADAASDPHWPMITLDTRSPVPPFEQIRAEIAAQVTNGVLAVGTRLPTVRRLADDLGLAVNTVARAYRELEAAGIVETRGRGGTIVTAAGDQARARMQAEALRYAALAHDLGMSTDEALRVIRSALDLTAT